MIATNTLVTRAHGMGRWFDAIGALVVGLSHTGFDGQLATQLEELAAGTGTAYPVELGPEIDLRPLVRSVVDDLLSGVSAGLVSARFHRTIIEVTGEAVRSAAAALGVDCVVLSGGCFHNHLLETGLAAALNPLRVLIPSVVPANDGGISLGQAWGAVLALVENAEAL